MRGRHGRGPRNLAVALLLGVVAVGAIALLRYLPTGVQGVEVGDRAPAYSAPDLSGQEVSFKDHLGEVVLVNVWTTWCGPCRVEMPSIQSSYERFRARGFTVLAVSVDAGLGHRQEVSEFVSEHGLGFLVLLDPENRITEMLRTFVVPETLVLNREGRIVKRVIGAADWDSPVNRTLIERLLRM